ncbi:MAG: hypothetical protein LBR70_00915 [Lactobacillaceae bacterium]|jgi:hypothetical protein|nr:hypothetical protein [Lactobacillaceae bacterium]
MLKENNEIMVYGNKFTASLFGLSALLTTVLCAGIFMTGRTNFVEKAILVLLSLYTVMLSVYYLRRAFYKKPILIIYDDRIIIGNYILSKMDTVFYDDIKFVAGKTKKIIDVGLRIYTQNNRSFYINTAVLKDLKNKELLRFLEAKTK